MESEAAEEDIECGEPVQDILFVPKRRSIGNRIREFGHGGPQEGVRSAGVGHEDLSHGFMKGAFRGAHEDQFGGDPRRGSWQAMWRPPHVDGNCSRCCRGCCSADHPEADLFRARGWKKGQRHSFNVGDWVNLIEFSLE